MIAVTCIAPCHYLRYRTFRIYACIGEFSPRGVKNYCAIQQYYTSSELNGHVDLLSVDYFFLHHREQGNRSRKKRAFQNSLSVNDINIISVILAHFELVSVFWFRRRRFSTILRQ